MTSPAHMPDPRRIIITVHSYGSSPRSRRWYSLKVACEFDGELFFHCSLEIPRRAGGNRTEAIKAAKAAAKEMGHPFVPGLWSGHAGLPMTRKA